MAYVEAAGVYLAPALRPVGGAGVEHAHAAAFAHGILQGGQHFGLHAVGLGGNVGIEALLELFSERRFEPAGQLAARFHGKRGERAVAFGGKVLQREHEEQAVAERQAGDGREPVLKDAEAPRLVEVEAEAHIRKRGLVLIILASAHAELLVQSFLRLARFAAYLLRHAQKARDALAFAVGLGGGVRYVLAGKFVHNGLVEILAASFA